MQTVCMLAGGDIAHGMCCIQLSSSMWLQSFAKRQVRDIAEAVPADYAPPDFTTAALQHTNVKLTWDADDDTRKKALRKKMTEDSIRDDDFKVRFLCSGISSTKHDPKFLLLIIVYRLTARRWTLPQLTCYVIKIIY